MKDESRPDEGAIVTVEEHTELQRQLDEIDVAALERRVVVMEAVKKILVQHTQPTDWLLMTTKGSRGKVAYLGADGAERVAALLGITWTEPRMERLQREGSYIWQYDGHFALAGRAVFALGSCSSRDKFFGRKGGAFIAENDVSERDVQMKGFSNWIRNGISRLLGLRNLGEGFFGETFWKKIPVVEFEGGGQGGTSKTQTPDEKKKADECWEHILSEAGGNEAKAADMLAKATSFPGRETGPDGKPKMVPGLTNKEYLTGKRLDILYGRISDAKKKKSSGKKKSEPPEPGSDAGFDEPEDGNE